jgi:uncharacterized metal-binding protein YceD (DUF177 family)
MPDLLTRSRDNPEFARVIEVARLEGLAEFAFDLRPTDDETRALARLLGARSLRKMRFAGRLQRIAAGGWALEAALGATVVQTCVVSLDPVTARVDQPVRRRFLPAPRPDAPGAAPDEADDVEPLGERIDLGLVAIEEMALALPDYPRKPGASLDRAARAAAAARPEAEVKPFAALAALRDKLDGRS